MSAAIVMSVWDPLRRFLERASELLPVLLAVVVVLLAGVLLAWLLEAAVRAGFSRLGFDRMTGSPAVSETLRKAGLWRTPSALAGQVMRWVVVVLSLLGAISILSAEATDTVIGSLVDYLPRLAAALLILVLGYAAGTFIARSVLLWAVNVRIRGARWLAGGVHLLVGIFFVALALEELGFGQDVALVVLAILLGGGVLAGAIAFGFAGQDLARHLLQRMTEKTQEEKRDTHTHL